MHSLGDFLCAATIISAKWKMFIQRKKYRQLRDAGQSPCDYPLHSLIFISHLYFNSFPIFTPSLSPSFIPSSLHSLPLLHPHSLPPSLPPSPCSHSNVISSLCLSISPSLTHTQRLCLPSTGRGSGPSATSAGSRWQWSWSESESTQTT